MVGSLGRALRSSISTLERCILFAKPQFISIKESSNMKKILFLAVVLVVAAFAVSAVGAFAEAPAVGAAAPEFTLTTN